MRNPLEPLDTWHVQYPKPGDRRCKCGRNTYPSAEHGRRVLRWQAVYTDPVGKPRKPGFKHYDEAVAFLAATLTDIRRGTWVDPELGKVLAVTLANEWLEWIKKKHDVENTVDTYTSHTKAHIIPFLGRREAGSLRRADSNAFVDGLIAKGLAVGTVHQIFKTYRIWIHWLVDEKEVPLQANVVQRIVLPKATKREAVELEPAEVARIAECIEPRFEVLVWMAACGGLREGEAFGMTKDRIDFLRFMWHIKEQRQRGKAVKTKTEASTTWNSVDPFLVHKIAAHLAAGLDKPESVQRATELRRVRRGTVLPADEGLIVTNHRGGPLNRNTFHDYWRFAVEEAGVDPDTRFHDLKHFYTRTLATSGNHDPKTVQRLSRHSRFEETWETYAGSGAGAETVQITAFSDAFTAKSDEEAAESA